MSVWARDRRFASEDDLPLSSIRACFAIRLSGGRYKPSKAGSPPSSVERRHLIILNKRIEAFPSYDLAVNSILCHLLAANLLHRLLDMDIAFQRIRQISKSYLVTYFRNHKRVYQLSQPALIRNRCLTWFERTNYLSPHRPLLGRPL